MVGSEEYGGRYVPPGCIYDGPLTKCALFSFPYGSVLLANSFDPDSTKRIFSVVPLDGHMVSVRCNVINLDGTVLACEEQKKVNARELLWNGIRNRRRQGRNCLVFRDLRSARHWLARSGACMPVIGVRR